MHVNAEFLPFEHDISKTVDYFRNQITSMEPVDCCELIEQKV